MILDQLLDGLSHVHAEGWIHRDVKPANIMFEPRGRQFVSRLADFGIAVHETDALHACRDGQRHPRLHGAGAVRDGGAGPPTTSTPRAWSRWSRRTGRSLHDGAFRPDEPHPAVARRHPEAHVIRQPPGRRPARGPLPGRRRGAPRLPRVPPGYPLTHADGAPLTFQDTLDPLPPNALARSVPSGPPPRSPSSMEAIRAGPAGLPSARPRRRRPAVGAATRWCDRGRSGAGRTGRGGPGTAPASSVRAPRPTPSPAPPRPPAARRADARRATAAP